ncbi:phosphatidylinositol N-acetylglucosaminyltransferase subunit Q [Copidosoma floridanum]|uniref:phosphatidylinositol N-acetylglucosaminyltransferase subunit Q n=1 Tax=Copidosoma floridanum TaxID=29053 RepID=UPI0006C94881|nr:phosphatidylinositol N-acetylglucosaminyltransferase subunit Q [Copidosoma floridanum]
MKTLLVFAPQEFCREKPGCMYGFVSHEANENEQLTKFMILGCTDSVKSINRTGIHVPLGYFHGTEKKCEYWDKRLPHWIELYLAEQTSTSTCNYEYGLRNVILENQKVSLDSCHTVLIVYDRQCFLRAELYTSKMPRDHLTELRDVLKKEAAREEKNRLHNTFLANFKEFFFLLLVLALLKPVSFFCQISKFMNPVFKYSSLGLHLTEWFQNAKWTLTTLLQSKRLTLKTTNYILAIIIDIVLGHLFLKLLLHFLGSTSRFEILVNHAGRVVESLKGLVNWLMGSPAGLKLNPPFNNVLGKFFLYHIHLWWAFLNVSKPMMELAIDVILFFGRFGITFQISIVADLLALVSFHTYCIYVYAARLFNIQVRGLIALFRLFLGKKKNPLRKRVDSCKYQPDQLFVGTLLFTILLFLMPTTWVYYFVFTVLRLIMIGLGGLLTRLKFYLQIMPVYAFFRWLFKTVDATGSIGIELVDRQNQGLIVLKTKAIIVPWNETWKKSIPDLISIYLPIEWNKIVSNVFWGQLLYPF